MTPTLKKLPEELGREKAKYIIDKYLTEKYISLAFVGEVKISEDVSNDLTKINCKIKLLSDTKEKTISINGKGSGPVDTLYKSLVSRLSKDYKSLEDLRLIEFKIDADIYEAQERPYYKSEVPVEAVLIVKSYDRNQLAFRRKSKSINRAAMDVIVEAIEHFINSGLAIKILKDLIVDAKKRSRGDLVDTYISDLSELAKSSFDKNNFF